MHINSLPVEWSRQTNNKPGLLVAGGAGSPDAGGDPRNVGLKPQPLFLLSSHINYQNTSQLQIINRPFFDKNVYFWIKTKRELMWHLKYILFYLVLSCVLINVANNRSCNRE